MAIPKFLLMKFGRTFWSTIIIEIYERGAWYGFFAVAPLFLTGPENQGALGLTHAQKGTILAIVPFFLYMVPVVSGTIGDKIGYKKVLLVSLAILSLGYFACGKAGGYYSFFGFFMLVALGAGMFKPMVTATVAKVTRGDKDKGSVAFGIFYMVVNLGGFLGPIIGGYFRPAIVDGVVVGSWTTLFNLSALYMVVMFFWCLFTYKEPVRDVQDKRESKSLGTKLGEMVTDLKDPKLSLLLIILVGFWATFLQFFYLMPSWITEWVDTSVLASISFLKPWVTAGPVGDQIKAEMLVNLNAFTLILCSVWVSAKVARLNLLKVINRGILMITLAVAIFSVTTPHTGSLGLVVLLPMIVFFSLGEILSSPRSNELMGRIAPKDKIGAYQGYMFLSVAGGFLVAGKMSALYGTFADKVGMYRQKIIDLKIDTTGLDLDKLGLYDLGKILKSNSVNLGQFNQQLWEVHNPWQLWLICAALGLTTVILLMIYRQFVPDIEKESEEE